jgi:hypothetical protein
MLLLQLFARVRACDAGGRRFKPGRVHGCSIVEDGDELGQISPNTFLSIPFRIF